MVMLSKRDCEILTARYDALREENARLREALKLYECTRCAALRGGGEHSKHPTGDYCVYCRSQWPCAESGEVK